ncbi:hypothetical protein [Clostridium perfringens]|uniref:hypothetical protein n=1 Tax=Clostridium perfringens TaxID=1502 RepID=UPI001A2C5FB4|nr:hypothetical protein [Clostridium perfringens]EJT6665752.1 hypothetical protein [Clostridium perfringens]MDM0552405.1 hypothetical protein [Clostridium perfringens]HAT4181225.1 hypothetical protein [Clostridium perfringens]HAT4331047.1 hypothetical protein [Clostridium perfringens]
MDIIEQEMNERNYNQYCLINAINVTFGDSEWLDFKDTLQRNIKVNVSVNKDEIKKIKEKQINILNKLL